MNRFTVQITTEVELSIRDAFYYIQQRSPSNALKWLVGLYQAINTLETMPNRCALIREQDAFDEEVRELLYHSHRIIFTVDEGASEVSVHAFRHSAQDDLRRDE
ncbi:MAG: type II toxin-antitoxin system RelE/ParE family toxin [Pirellulales bacterium]